MKNMQGGTNKNVERITLLCPWHGNNHHILRIKWEKKKIGGNASDNKSQGTVWRDFQMLFSNVWGTSGLTGLT